MIDLDKIAEGIDYEIQPFDGSDNEQSWQVFVKTGVYRQMVLLFTSIKFDGPNSKLTFALNAMNLDLSEPEITQALKDHAADILEDIIKSNLAKGTLVIEDDKDNKEVS